jgi:DNA-binding transcriptional regulator YiaG
MLEDALPGLVKTRQHYPRNGLRRSGITACVILFDDPARAALYFSSGKTSVEGVYSTPTDKKYSRDHWAMGYTAISKSLGTDRAHLLPPDHKLDEFRTSEVIATENKISEDAAAFEDSLKESPQRREGFCAENPKYTPEDRRALIAEYQQRILSGKEITLDEYAKEKNVSASTLTMIFQAVGFKEHRTEEKVSLLVEEFRKEDKKGVSVQEFSSKKGIPERTLRRYFQAAGLCSKRHSSEEISALLEQFAASGMTGAEFAEKIGVSLSALRNWKSDAAKNAATKEGGLGNAVQKEIEKRNAVVVDYQSYKKKDPDLTPKKFAELRGIAYSTLRAQFAKVGGLLASIKHRSRDEIRKVIQDYDKAREENPALTRKDYASKHGITRHTLDNWLSPRFRVLVFSENGTKPNICSG